MQTFKIETILKAWTNVFKGITTDEHKHRAKICSNCRRAKYHKFMDFMNDDLQEVKGFVCSECNCPLIAKIRSNDNCPLNLW